MVFRRHASIIRARVLLRAVMETMEERRLLAGTPALDTVVFGNTTSETGHSFAANSSQVITGGLSQSARQLLPLSTVAVNGGEMSVTMAVDPNQRNYFTIKLWGGDGWSNFSAYAKVAIVGMGIVGEPNVIKQFTSNQPQLAGQLKDAINLIGGMDKNQPQSAKQLEQLRNILGALNGNTNGNFPPQNAGAWDGNGITTSLPDAPVAVQSPVAHGGHAKNGRRACG